MIASRRYDCLGGDCQFYDRFHESFTYGPLGVISRTEEMDDADVANNHEHYYLADPMGGHMGMLVDHDGLPATPRDMMFQVFDSFGMPITSRLEFTGQYAWRGMEGSATDDFPNLVEMGARTYDPTIGRFLQTDLVSVASTNSQGLNRYIYCENDPLNRSDPFGLFGIWDTLAVVGASVSILSGAALVAAGPASFFGGLGLVAAGVITLLQLAAEGTDNLDLRCSLLRAAAYAAWIMGIAFAIQAGLVLSGIGLTFGLSTALSSVVPNIAALGGAGAAIGRMGLAGPFWDN